MSIFYYQVIFNAFIFTLSFGQLQNTSIHLNLSTTACQQNCVIYDKRQRCPANIYVNGRQMSPTQDGFNVVVVDLPSGNTTYDYFRWFRSSYVGEREEFIGWFDKVKNGSVVVVVLQNMCYYFDQKWYAYLEESGVLLANASVSHHNMAVVVGCKTSCLPTNGVIPFSYFGQDESEFSTQISIKLRVDSENTRIQAQQTTRTSDHPIQIGIILGVMFSIVLLVVLLVVLYIWHKKRSVLLLWCIKANRSKQKQTEAVDKLPTKPLEINETVQTPVYEELVLRKADESPDYVPVIQSESVLEHTRAKDEHIYEDVKPNLIKTREAENEYYRHENDVLLTADHEGSS